MSRHRSGPDVDYVQQWFFWKLLLVEARIAATAIGVVIMVVGLIITAIAPAYLPAYLDGFGICFLAVCGLILCRWIYLLGRLCTTKKPIVHEEFVPQGAIANPPAPWFDSRGHWLWARSKADGLWLPITDGSRELEWRDPPARPMAPPPPGNRDMRREPRFGR